LHEDAIRPWFHRSWTYPRDPKFIEKTGKVLDLYEEQVASLQKAVEAISADGKACGFAMMEGSLNEGDPNKYFALRKARNRQSKSQVFI